jgi:hypothetical protein
MTDQPKPQNREEFLERYANSWNVLESLISGYDAEQMVVPADAAGWNVRDHLAHLCAWEATMIAFLRKEHQWEACGLTQEQHANLNYDPGNEIIRQMTLNVSPSDVIDMLKETNAEFLETLATVSDEDLASKASDYHPDWKNKQKDYTVLFVLGGDTWDHFDEHRPWIEKIVTG